MTTILAPGAEFERTITGLTAGTQYRFRVRARNANGYGPYSAWSTPGTPTSGTPAPPPSSVVAKVSLTITSKSYTTGYSGTAIADVALSDTNALAGAATYTWQGRYPRVQTLASGKFAGRFTTNGNSTWSQISTTYAPMVGGYQVGDIYGWQGRIVFSVLYGPGVSFPSFPNNFWEMRCQVSVPYILNGITGTAVGVSRVFAFKELWGGFDYPTEIIPLIP